MFLPSRLARALRAGVTAGGLVAAAVAMQACRPATPPTDHRATIWLTAADSTLRLTPVAPVAAEPVAIDPDEAARDRAQPRIRVQLAPDSLRQPWLGVGAALTDASVALVQALPPARRDSLWTALFTDAGAGLGVLRVPVGASDFSTTIYSYADTPGRAAADLSRDEADRLPLLRAARRLDPGLAVILAPWSAPAWMKSTGSMIGGTLRRDAESTYVTYLETVVAEYTRRGVAPYALSLQNEPAHEPKDYPGMRLTAAQRARLFAQLGPRLAAADAGASSVPVRLLEWDHNWDHPEEPLAVLADSAARPFVHGVAWHCYGGDVQTQARVRTAAPDVAVYFTECSGGAWAPNFADNLRWNARTLLIGATVAYARTVLLWNLALDPQGGPHRGGCGNCRGVLTIDPVQGTVTPNVEYWVLAHIGRFVRAGDRRIEAQASAPDLPVVAFRQAADDRRVVILLNDAAVERTIDLIDGAHRYPVRLPAGALATVTFPP